MKKLHSLVELLEYAKEVGPKRVSVARAEDADVLEAVDRAQKEGIAEVILVGNADKIAETARSLGIDLSRFRLVDARGSEAEVGLAAVELVSSGQADILMKGMIQTANFLRGVLDKERGLRTGLRQETFVCFPGKSAVARGTSSLQKRAPFGSVNETKIVASETGVAPRFRTVSVRLSAACAGSS